MARGKRRRPLLTADLTSAQNDFEEEPATDDDRDDVEQFVANRHMHMSKMYGIDHSDTDDAEDEPETKEYNVLKMHSSDSEDSDEEEGEEEEDEGKGDWGGKRRNWYGGDTHEYEIMEREEREEILQDEEEEAIRLQQKALHRTRPEDYVEEEEDDSEADLDEEESQGLETEPASLDPSAPAPELNLLATEFQKSLAQLSEFKERSYMDEIDRIKYQLLGLFVTNAALYFSLRTDPDSVGVDVRTHPVLSRIVQIRTLLRNTKSVLREKPKNTNAVEEPANGKLGDNEEQTKATQDQDVLQPENDAATSTDVPQKQSREKRKKKRRAAKEGIAADEAKVLSLLQPINDAAVVDDEETSRDRKRRKLNKIVGAMERERKNSDAKRMASADLDVVREEARNARPGADYQNQAARDSDGVDAADLIDDDEVMGRMLAKREKKEARKARKAASSTPHVYTFKDKVDPDAKRKASTQVIKNRGLTRYRPRDKKTPRTKNRLAYGKAVVRRKGAVREYAGTHGGSYGGEASGINMSARKSSAL